MTADIPSGRRWQALIPLATIALSLLPFLLAPVRARLLSPDGRGEFAFFQSSYIVISAVGALGARHAYYSLRGSGDLDRPLIGTRASISAAVASAAAGIPLLSISLAHHSIETSILIAVAASAGPIHLFIQVQLARAQYSGRDARVVAITGAPAAWEFFSNLALIALNAMTVFWVSLLAMSTEAVRATLSLKWKRQPKPDRSVPVTDAFARALWTFAIVGVTPLLVSNLDVITYGALLPAEQLGLYAVAKLALTLLLFGTLVLEGRFTNTAIAFGRTEILTIVTLGAGAAIGGTAGFFLITPVFGEPYRAAAGLFVAMAGAGFLGGLHILLTAKAAARQLPRLVTASSLTVAAIALLLSIVVASLDGPVLSLAAPMTVAYMGGLIVLIIGLARTDNVKE